MDKLNYIKPEIQVVVLETMGGLAFKDSTGQGTTTPGIQTGSGAVRDRGYDKSKDSFSWGGDMD